MLASVCGSVPSCLVSNGAAGFSSVCEGKYSIYFSSSLYGNERLKYLPQHPFHSCLLTHTPHTTHHSPSSFSLPLLGLHPQPERWRPTMPLSNYPSSLPSSKSTHSHPLLSCIVLGPGSERWRPAPFPFLHT